MEKAELIEKLKSYINNCPSDNWDKGYNEGIKSVINIVIKQLDEPQKVKVPQFVADWLDKAKRMEVSLSEAIDYDNDFISDASDVFTPLREWLSYSDNQEIFARAWLDGYEVEKEQLYYVLLPDKDGGYPYTFLSEDGAIDVENQLCEVDKLTESQIKEIDERYWPFAVKVEEEKECSRK